MLRRDRPPGEGNGVLMKATPRDRGGLRRDHQVAAEIAAERGDKHVY